MDARAKIYDISNNFIKSVLCDSNGYYDTGVTYVPRGITVKLKAEYTVTGEYSSDYEIYVVTTSFACSVDFVLNRELGTVKAFTAKSREHHSEFISDFHDLEFHFEVNSLGSLLYDPDQSYYDHCIETWLYTPGEGVFLGGYTLWKSKITVLATNHWSDDVSFMELYRPYWEAGSWGDEYQVG
jgi:hypothetical protein